MSRPDLSTRRAAIGAPLGRSLRKKSIDKQDRRWYGEYKGGTHERHLYDEGLNQQNHLFFLDGPRVFLLLVLACVLASFAGARSGTASCTGGIQGIGNLQRCYSATECDFNYQFECVQFCCSGSGSCGQNCGSLCTLFACSPSALCGATCG